MTSFTYTQGLPTSSHFPSADVNSMTTNCNSIYSWNNVDHITFGSPGFPGASIDGRHRQVAMPNQNAPGVPSNTNGVFFANAVSSKSWPFWQNASQSFQMLGGNVSDFTNFAANNAYGSPPSGFTQTGGYSFLPGGLIFQYGFYGNATSIGTSGTIPFVVPFNNTAFNVQISLLRNDASETIILDNSNLPSTTGFGFKASSSGGRGIYWTAVGN